MSTPRKIAILTGGGDCPGINAVIRAVTKRAIAEYGMEVIGIQDGYYGLIYNCYRPLCYTDVSGILIRGGTILGTSNVDNPYHQGVERNGRTVFEDVSPVAIANLKALDIDCLVCIGGDGTLTIASKLARDGVPVVGVPKTIDNDLRGTDITFGFDSAVAVATEGIDRVHSTAQSHHRIMIVEVMGRHAGWIALHAGVAGGGDIILIPEIPYDIGSIKEKINERTLAGNRFSIVVIAEGAKPQGGDVVIKRTVEKSTDPVRLGGVGMVLGAQLEQETGMETRAVVLGHLQRGGVPTPYDRVLATRLGTRAAAMVNDSKFGRMVAVRGDTLTEASLEEAAGGPRTVPPDHPLIASARSIGTCFGDSGKTC